MPRPDSIRILCWLAAACFLASWFLPVLSAVPGWMAFRYALSPLWPYGEASTQGAEDSIPQVASALTNVAFVMMFIMVLSQKVLRPSLFFRFTIIFFVIDLYWFVQFWRDGSLGDLWVGYYIWLAAFALMVLIGWMLLRGRRVPR
jgi:hypothetical protein